MLGIKKKKSTGENTGLISLNLEEKQESNRYLSNQKKYVDLIYPSGIEVTDPRYILMDGAYVACLLCINLSYEIPQNFLGEFLNAGEGIELFLNHTPVNKAEAVKDITHYLGFTNYKRKKGGENQVDSGLQENAAAHSVYMKKKLAEGDEFWYINLIVKVTAESEEMLDKKLRMVEGIMAGKDIFCKRADFRQMEAFLSTLPLDAEKFHPQIKKQTERNILSSGLCAMYPFTSSSISDAEGIFMGINEKDNNQIIIDIFDSEKYSNANMLLTGNSGSGKTFTAQMIADRFRMQKIPVMMICPYKGHEYRKLCEAVGGNYFRFAAGSANTVNMYDIRETKNIERKEESWLAEKQQKLRMLHRLMLPGIDKSMLNKLEDLVGEIYYKKGIKMDDNASIFIRKPGIISLTPKRKEMPILADVYEAMKGRLEFESTREDIKSFVDGSMSFFNGQTNVDLDSIYTVADISDMPDEWISLAMTIITDIFWDRIKGDLTQKICLFLDEIWRVAGKKADPLVSAYIMEIWKIIRGYGGSAVASTQDIQDLESDAGKAIVNQSKIKIALQMEETEAMVLQRVLGLSEEETMRITHFERGHGLLYAANNHLTVNFMPFESERRLITTDRKERLKYKEA
ncbi:hypothetical protein [Sinanaerobacter sp. ZZT-01]|uniref:VirB4 family type IV secretion system protein n=1 Tax=Sinanaerobacter sp. ZZT-01 TaxID=3111540 RepID=UPI002D78E606|nr:hypothetical protein [Sinanaerobacter sp. ZZT-01]WRR93381.1 hypothetical protein U5921_15330 [Sinanaerobacter sp. ZZT-01]